MKLLVHRAGGWNQHGHRRKGGVSFKPVFKLQHKDRLLFWVWGSRASASVATAGAVCALWGLTCAAESVSGQCVCLPLLKGQSPPWRVTGAGWLAHGWQMVGTAVVRCQHPSPITQQQTALPDWGILGLAHPAPPVSCPSALSSEWRSTLTGQSLWMFRAASSTEGLWSAGWEIWERMKNCCKASFPLRNA